MKLFEVLENELSLFGEYQRLYPLEYENIFNTIDYNFLDTLLNGAYGSKTVTTIIENAKKNNTAINILCYYLHYLGYTKMLNIKRLYELTNTKNPIEKNETIDTTQENIFNGENETNDNNVSKIYAYDNDTTGTNENETTGTNTNNITNTTNNTFTSAKTNIDFNIDTIKKNVSYSVDNSYLMDCFNSFISLVTVDIYEY